MLTFNEKLFSMAIFFCTVIFGRKVIRTLWLILQFSWCKHNSFQAFFEHFPSTFRAFFEYFSSIFRAFFNIFKRRNIEFYIRYASGVLTGWEKCKISNVNKIDVFINVLQKNVCYGLILSLSKDIDVA